MQLALGLAALLVGVNAVISQVTTRPFSRLMFGYWDAPGTTGVTGKSPTAKTAKQPGTALTGGAYATGQGNIH